MTTDTVQNIGSAAAPASANHSRARRFRQVGAEARTSVKRGFEGYREFCMTCHMVNGEGGNKAMDLNSPRSVTEYHDEVWLKNFISDPTRIRPETRMSALDRNLPDRDKLIMDIIAYPKAMASERR